MAAGMTAAVARAGKAIMRVSCPVSHVCDTRALDYVIRSQLGYASIMGGGGGVAAECGGAAAGCDDAARR